MRPFYTYILLIPFLFLADSLTAQVVTNIRTSDLQPGGYTISGLAFLEELDNGSLQLRLSSDFATPRGPDVRIYLSSSDRVNDSSVEIVDIGNGRGGINHFNGAATFPVPEGITIDQFNYIVFYCYDFHQHWAQGVFGEVEATGNVPSFQCQESSVSTTNQASEITVCTNDGAADIVAISNDINELAGDNYAYIITDENNLIEQVILSDTYDFEGSETGISRIYGVSYDGTLDYTEGELYTSITASGCATLSSASGFLSIIKEGCQVSIQGQITQANGAPVEGFDVFLNDVVSATTDASGNYQFEDLDNNETYTLVPQENGNTDLGISTRDLVIIRRHLLAIEPFTSDFQAIAADVSNNGSVSTRDLVDLQRLILGVDVNFQNNQSYRFVQEAALANLDPSDFAESITFDNLADDRSDVDFIAIKIGDVSNSAISGILGDDILSQSALELSISELQVTAGERVSIPLVSSNFENIDAFQFTIHLDGFTFEDIQSEILSEDELQFAQIDNETVTVLWSSATPRDIDDSPFSLELVATRDLALSEAIALSSAVTNALAYDADGRAKNIEFSINTNDQQETNALFQNTPNPFSQKTTIPFHLSESSEVSLRIYDVTGSIVQALDRFYDEGRHQLEVNGLDQLPQGVLYYQLIAGDYQETKKMIKR